MASSKAIKAADERMDNFRPSKRWDSGGRREKTEVVLVAAHDPALGLDRSVCLREVVDALIQEGMKRGLHGGWGDDDPARFIEERFT